MTPAEIQLIVTLGATGVLIALVGLILRGDLVPKGAASAIVTELRASRDEWKALAKDAIEDVGQLADALRVRNEIDAALAQRSTIVPETR